jgi:hypothetical protein
MVSAPIQNRGTVSQTCILLQFRTIALHRLDGYGVGIVLRSETVGVQVGKYVYGLTICSYFLLARRQGLILSAVHQEYTVYPELGSLQIIEPHPGLSLTAYVTAAGMPGLCHVVI